MALRARRLASDAQTIRRCFGPNARIRLIAAEGDPPERYRFEYQVNSLVVQNGEVVPTTRQIVEVYLTLSYPRQAPQCRMLTPIFHPNIAPHAVCIGDHWSAGESLAALLVRIAEMLTYQSYNLQSPLNGDAAKWADEHMSELPLEDFDFGSLLAGAHPAESASAPFASAHPGESASAPFAGAHPGESASAPFASAHPAESASAPFAGALRPSADSPIERSMGPPLADTTGSAPIAATGPISTHGESATMETPLEGVQPRGGPDEAAEGHPEPRSDPAESSEGRPLPPSSPRSPHTAECPSCGAALSLPENRPPSSWMRCPLCGRMLRT